MNRTLLSYSDFPLGRAFKLGPRLITQQEMIDFAAKYDPQPFHIDPSSKEAQDVGGLIASGWHTCAIVMRLMCDSYLLNSASQGSGGLDEVRWLKPVRPGDVLSGTATVADRRRSSSRPNLGILTFEYAMHNQHGDDVISIKGMGMIDVLESETL